MEVNFPLLIKDKKKNTLEMTPDKTTTPLDIDASFNASENFLNKDTTSLQAFEQQKPSFHRFFLLKNFLDFRCTEKEHDHACSIPLPNLDNHMFMSFDSTKSRQYLPNSKQLSRLKDCYSLFVLNNIIRVHMCNLLCADILACSKFLAKLTGLPIFMTSKQLAEIGKMVDAIS
ncbi:14022_t:CDS:2 [Funneliformis geosporum]|nr:14022_t:CDS:2 [Funneliformis geosporum]